MKWLLPAVVFLGLFFTPLGQSDDLTDQDLHDLEEALFENETPLTNNETSEENNGREFSTTSFEEDTNEKEVEETDERPESVENGVIDSCGNPPLVKNAKISGQGSPPYAVGTSLSYSCEYGYSADGASHTSICTETTTGSKPIWTDPNILCIPRSCGDPGFVTNAHRQGSRFTFPNSVSFECDGGYELRGSNIRYCQVNGRWSGSLPSCEKIFCPEPDQPEHGRVSYSSLEYGSKLRYECDKGYILKNHYPRECSENGTWSGVEPFCLDAQCDIPVAPEHGFVETVGGAVPRVGSIAIYSCENGRKLVGSGTSKCLDIGEWTFPAPKCVEPCSVPTVLHGTIGIYEARRWPRSKQFQTLSPGTTLEGREELFLKCDNEYEPFGKNVTEAKVICENGLWKNDPICEPAKCRSNPPEMENGKAKNINKEHGGGVVYYCNRNFIKTKYGNVTCHFGVWKGYTPTCADRRCYVNKIEFPGLIKGSKNVYFNTESFKPLCGKGYQVARPDSSLVCNEGTWKGHFPPCTAASCLQAPPSIQHGRIKSYNEQHSSIVTYECNGDYILQSPSQVQCSFGEWKGTPPVCKDSRCYFKDLKMSKGMVVPSKDPTNDRETIDVQCASGYSSLDVKPICSKGEWVEHGSPCKENNCMVEEIAKGALTELTIKRRRTWTRTYNEYVYEKARIGVTKIPGEHLYVTCNNGYSFQGKNMDDVSTKCTEGKWKPTPICLIPGSWYEEKVEVVSSTTTNLPTLPAEVLTEKPQPASSTVVPTKQTFPETFPSLEDSMRRNFDQARAKEDCFCTYQGSADLIAFAGNELLTTGSKVKSNSVVKFHCKNYGYSRLMGPTEIVCKDCRPWHSSEYPDCVMPLRGDAILQFEPNVVVFPGGIVAVNQGDDTRIMCIANAVAIFPEWTSTVKEENWFTYEALEHPDGGYRYSTILSIHKAGPQHNGKYSCSVPGSRNTTLQLQVLSPQCIKFDENGDLVVHYDMKQNVNSSALFSCKDRYKRLEGSSVLTCLSNGEWSGQPPKCISVGCSELKETEGMLISYSNGLEIGSTATFHCFVPRVRKGESQIKCLRNSEWSGSVPSCTLLRCPLESLFEHIPESVAPDMEKVTNDTVPYGFELPLLCDGNLRLSEPASAKCGNDGKWEVSKVRCVPGCGVIETPPDSQLIIEPVKDFYRFGELVDLSCAPGQVLSSEVETLMCLRNGWSEKNIPSCIDDL